LPFGEELYSGIGTRNTSQKYSANGDDTRKKFATYQRDAETNLDFAQSRYYSPMQGRFTSPDEFKGGPDELFDFESTASNNPTFYADLGNPQSLNKYQYAYGNPCKYRDPSGHAPEGCWQKIVGAVGGGVFGGVAGFLVGVPAGGVTGAIICSETGPGGAALCGAAGAVTGQALFTIAGGAAGAVAGYTFIPCPKSNSTQTSSVASSTLGGAAAGISNSAEHTKRRGSKKKSKNDHTKAKARKQREQNRLPRKTPKNKKDNRLNPPKRKPGDPRKNKYPPPGKTPRNPNDYNTPMVP
jgi:RHS repeat-associated protein